MELSVETVSRDDGAQPTRRASVRPVDLVHLSRYTLGNRSLEQEVLGLFLTQSTLYLSRLKDAADDKTWRDAAHTIKGSARGIGAWHVVASAEAAEKLQGARLKAGRARSVAVLEDDIREANSYIRSLLAGV